MKKRPPAIGFDRFCLEISVRNAIFAAIITFSIAAYQAHPNKRTELQMNLRHLLSLFLLTILLATELSAQVTRGYKNPVIPGYYPDPSVCRVGEDYYLVNSSFQFFPGVPIFHSRDLIHWEQIGNVLNRESQLPLKGANCWLGIYAPTIRYWQGIYYMITTNVGNGGNFMVTASDPRGPWSDPIWLEQQGIDPSLYFEEEVLPDGRKRTRCYMVSNPDAAIWLCEIDPRTGRQTSRSTKLWEGTGGRHPEAPHIYHKDGWYYLMIAEGGTEMGHQETIARSRSIYGPYEANPDNPILYHQRRIAQDNPIQGTGHADLVEAHDGSWWAVNLAFRPQVNGMHLTGRETYLAPVVWNDKGWPVINGNGVIHTDMNVPTLPQKPIDNRFVRDNFDGVQPYSSAHSLGPEWVWLNNPIMTNYRVGEGRLTLKASSRTLDQEGETMTFVGRRQQHIEFLATTALQLKSQREGDEAGMTIYMNGQSHYDLAVVSQGKNKPQKLIVRYRLGELLHTAAEVELKELFTSTNLMHKSLYSTPTLRRPVTIRIKGEAEKYTFYYSVDGGMSFKTLGRMDTRYLSTETAGGFTGIVLGLYAQGPVGTMGTADFEYFDYDGQ